MAQSVKVKVSDLRAKVEGAKQAHSERLRAQHAKAVKEYGPALKAWKAESLASLKAATTAVRGGEDPSGRYIIQNQAPWKPATLALYLEKESYKVRQYERDLALLDMHQGEFITVSAAGDWACYI